jgi:exopolyphosphatase / guanosine-5'-triphosphate,3'-diphosphate pyrophosphatase
LKLAAIDIGSNSIKLVVVDAAASDSFVVLAREKEVVRLGHETLREGHLSTAAIERAAVCIKRLRSIAEARGAERIITIATASVREAYNSAEFVDEVERQTGMCVEILSGVEEARLIGLAAAQGCAGRRASLINIDIGGGSTEISFMRDRVPAELYSVKLGAVGLTEQLIANDPPKQKEIGALREEIRAALEQPARELQGMRWQKATGTSGTIIAIGEALRLRTLRQPGMEDTGAQPAGAEIALDRLARFNERTGKMNIAERRTIPGISAQRAEIIIAGGQILEGAMRAFGIDSLRSCDYALREGVIIDRLREWEAELPSPAQDAADGKLTSMNLDRVRT